MKLLFNQVGTQPDPYVIKVKNAYYMYSTHIDGVQLYKSLDRIHWEFLGLCFSKEGEKEYWAPAVKEIDGVFYLYYSSMPLYEMDSHEERICVAISSSPEGPFVFEREMIKPFSIDAHVVESGGELYMFYSTNDYNAKRAGTLIVVDKMTSPIHMAGQPKVVLRATVDEEIYMRDRFKPGQHWHTLEGAFYFEKDGYHYLMYSGNCYQNEYYYVGYAVAKSNDTDLLNLEFVKYPNENTYCPLLARNEAETGTGHNSVLVENGKYYVFYHGRDIDTPVGAEMENRTARMCELEIDNGVLIVHNR